MISVSMAEAKVRMGELLDRLEEEEEIIITRHGQAVARLLAVPRTKLYDHCISSPMPLARETVPGELEQIDSGPITFR